MLEFPAYLLQIDKTALGTKVTSRIMESKWGGQGSHMIGKYTIESTICICLYLELLIGQML